MAEEILSDPGLFIGDAELLFCVDIEVICSFFCEKWIFGVEDFETTCYVIVFKSKKVSFYKGEFLFLGVVYYFLYVFTAE